MCRSPFDCLHLIQSTRIAQHLPLLCRIHPPNLQLYIRVWRRVCTKVFYGRLGEDVNTKMDDYWSLPRLIITLIKTTKLA